MVANQVVAGGSKTNSVNISDLSKGIYFIQVSNVEFYYTGKFIKQ